MTTNGGRLPDGAALEALLRERVQALRGALEDTTGENLATLHERHSLQSPARPLSKRVASAFEQQSEVNAAATRLIASLVERSVTVRDELAALRAAVERVGHRPGRHGSGSRAVGEPEGRPARHDEAIAWLRDSGPVLHVGARPGAFLEAARDVRLEAVAAVPDFDAVTRLRAAGLNGLTLEPIAYLEATAPDSLGGLHVDATSGLDELERIAALAASRLVPGGRIAFAYLRPDEHDDGRRFEHALAGLPFAAELLLTRRPD